MLTDLPAVLPRLQRNAQTNLAPAALRGPLLLHLPFVSDSVCLVIILLFIYYYY